MLRKPIILMTIAWSTLVLPQSVYADQSVAEAVKQCAQTPNSLQRLVCFDGIASRLQDYSDDVLPRARVTPSAPANLAAEAPPVTSAMPISPANAVDLPFEPNNRVEDFGRVEIVKDTLLASVAALTYDRNDYFTVTLNNGQMWRQTEVSRIKIDVGDRIEIEEGVFGSFILTSEASNRTARVKRVK